MKSKLASPIGIEAFSKKKLEWYLKRTKYKNLVIKEVKEPAWHKNMGFKWKRIWRIEKK